MTSLLSPHTQDNKVYRLAGAASIMCALCYATGLITVFFFEPGLTGGAEERLSFIQHSGHLLQLWYFVIFIVFGFSIVLLNAGFRRWLLPSPSALLQVAFITSFVWAAYIFASGFISILTIQYLLSVPYDEQRTVWYAIYSIQSGLGEGVEWVGGLWMLFLSIYLLKARIGNDLLNLFALFIGLAGSLTLIPGMWIAGALFGITQLLWFLLTGGQFLKQASTD